MCGRYLFLFGNDYEYNAIIREAARNDPNAANFVSGQVAPSAYAPVLFAQDKQIKAKFLTWGYPGFEGKKLIINARRESAAQKPMFRAAIDFGRCAIPSSGFFEWQKNTGKQYLFEMPGQPILYMAGLYASFDGTERFVILTGQANDSVAMIHNRMPLVLTEQNYKAWVTDPAYAKQALSAPLPMLSCSAYSLSLLE